MDPPEDQSAVPVMKAAYAPQRCVASVVNNRESDGYRKDAGGRGQPAPVRSFFRKWRRLLPVDGKQLVRTALAVLRGDKIALNWSEGAAQNHAAETDARSASRLDSGRVFRWHQTGSGFAAELDPDKTVMDNLAEGKQGGDG